MKKMWNQFKNWKYFKIVIVVFLILMLGLLIYLVFVRGYLQFKRNEEKFVEGVKNYYEYNPLKLPKEGDYVEHKLTDMFQGSWVESIYVPGKNKLCDGDSFVRVANEDGKYRYITYLKCGRYESQVDHRAPDIVLNGDDTIVIHLGETYQDAGVQEVKDNHDKIDVSKVKIDTSKVDTSKMGTYEVTYRVLDKNYNVSKKVRTVVVAETLSAHIRTLNGENFRYTGDATDNYVLLSGLVWRIVKLNDDETLELITDNSISNVSYGAYDKEYPDSNIYKWLNQYFLSNLSENSKKYILDSKWCYDDVANVDSANSCNSSVTAKVGLLSFQDYENSFSKDRSYLNTFSQFCLLNRQNTQNVWLSNVYEVFSTINIKSLVGVRPVIRLSKDIFVTAGKGTQDDPYKLQDYYYGKENDLLNTRLTGEYVVYSGYTFRIAGTDKEGNIKLVGTNLLRNSSNNTPITSGYSSNSGLTPDVHQNGNLYAFLDQEAMNYISEKFLISHEFEVPIYKTDADFDQFEIKKVTSKIGLPASFEMFSSLSYFSGDDIYWLSDYNEEGIVSILNGSNGLAFYLNRDTFVENAIKPVVYLNRHVKIASGKGIATDPYYVR